MSERLIGMEVDGDRVTIVETRGELAVSARTIALGSLEASLAVAAKKLPRRVSRAVRVGIVTPSTTLRRIDATAEIAGSRTAFENAAFTVLPVKREANSVAGLFFDRDALVGDAVAPGAAVIAPVSSVSKVYDATRRRELEVVAAPFTLTGFDGVWLGLHHDAVEVTLLSGGRPWAYRQLRAGGLSALVAQLDIPTVMSGSDRLTALLTASGSPDPTGAAELDRYVRMVAAELHQTVEFWRKSGEPVPDSGLVLAYGRGAAAPTLGSALGEFQYAPSMPRAFNEAMMHIPLAERPEALGAFLAAVTSGRDLPEAVFVNPMVVSAATHRRRRSRLVLVGAVAAAVAAAGAVTVVKPQIDRRSELSTLRAELDSARAEFAAVEGVFHQTEDLRIRAGAVAAARSGEPNWPVVVATAYGTVPAGGQIVGFSSAASGTSVSVTLSATVTGGDYDDLTGWIETLRAIDGVSGVWSAQFAVTASGEATFQISFVIDTAVAGAGDVSAPPQTVPDVPDDPATPSGGSTPSDGSTPPTSTPVTTTTVLGGGS